MGNVTWSLHATCRQESLVKTIVAVKPKKQKTSQESLQSAEETQTSRATGKVNKLSKSRDGHLVKDGKRAAESELPSKLEPVSLLGLPYDESDDE